MKENLSVVSMKPRPYVFKITESIARSIREDSILVGFFIVHKDKTTTTGWSNEGGVADIDFYGGCESLQQHWGREYK